MRKISFLICLLVTGQIFGSEYAILNNMSNWGINVTYKNVHGRMRSLYLRPHQQCVRIPLADIRSGRFLSLAHAHYMYNLFTAPAPYSTFDPLAQLPDKYDQSKWPVLSISVQNRKFTIKTDLQWEDETLCAESSEEQFQVIGYASLFEEPLPNDLRDTIVHTAEQVAGGKKKLHAFYEKLRKARPNAPHLYYPLKIIAGPHGFKAHLYDKTLVFFADLLKGKREETELRGSYPTLLRRYVDTKDPSLIIPLASSYKIHLMPLKENRIRIMYELMRALQKDPELQEVIAGFKIVASDLPYRQARNNKRLPADRAHLRQNAVIVIYPADGRKNTQQALNKIYELFPRDKFPGINIRPRYNARVNNLIWIAQGDGDAKSDRELKKYFEPNMIYFNPKALGFRPTPIGAEQVSTFHLVHPETGKDITSVE